METESASGFSKWKEQWVFLLSGLLEHKLKVRLERVVAGKTECMVEMAMAFLARRRGQVAANS